MIKKLLTILAGVALLVALAPAIGLADSISGSSGAGWQTWGPSVPTGNTGPYWNGLSSDGATKGLGYCITGTGTCNMSPDPGSALSYWGYSNGSADSDITFTADSSSNGAALTVELAGNANYNSFGYCDTTGCHVIFAGSVSPGGAGSTVTFTPVGTYTFYFTDACTNSLAASGKCSAGVGPTADTWNTNTSLNTQGGGGQHFAIFNGGGGTYWLGMEDLPLSNTDKDYQDMVVEITSGTPVPEPGTLTLLGTGLISLAGFIRRRRAA